MICLTKPNCTFRLPLLLSSRVKALTDHRAAGTSECWLLSDLHISVADSSLFGFGRRASNFRGEEQRRLLYAVLSQSAMPLTDAP